METILSLTVKKIDNGYVAAILKEMPVKAKQPRQVKTITMGFLEHAALREFLASLYPDLPAAEEVAKDL